MKGYLPFCWTAY